MIKRIINKLKKVNKNINFSYLKYLENPIDDKLVLLEGGQGTNINGNMFSMLKEIMTNPEWKDYKAIFVVTEKTAESAKDRIKLYGFNRVSVVMRDSNEYCKYLATAKYLMTDNSFPPYFDKRAEQVFLNTWHGTPLKTLGISDKSFKGSTANIQKNYMMSDYALFPNEFTKNVFMEDYDLKDVFCQNTLVANYPRNYIFYNHNQGLEMKKTLGYDGKNVFAYMPTWRGTGRKANTKKQIEDTIDILKQLDEKLDDDTVLLVNLHFLLASAVDCSEFQHIAYFPAEYDTYEILNACDGLITDYSSVFFDFAVTGRKIILFAYDKEDYFSSRGVYIPFEELPFPITETVADTVNEMKVPVKEYSKFIEEYCPNGSYEQCGDIFRMLVKRKTDKFEIIKHQTAENICLIYAGNLNSVYYDSIRNYIEENSQYKHIIVYGKTLNTSKREYIESFSGQAGFYGLLNAYQYNIKELLSVVMHKIFNKVSPSKTLDVFFEKEAHRRFYEMKPVKVVDFTGSNFIMAGILSKLCDDKVYIKHGDFFIKSRRNQRKAAFVKSFESNLGYKVFNNSDKENELYNCNNEENIFAHISFRKYSKFKNIIPLYMSSSKKLKCVSLFSFKTPVKVAMKDTFLCVGNEEYSFKMLGSKNKLSYKHRGLISFEIPVEKIIDMPASNKVMLCYKNRFGKIVQCHAYYLAALGSRFLGLRSTMLHDKETNTVAVFRQSTKNNLNVYVRSFITSDKVVERIKQFFAFCISLFWNSEKAKSLVLLFEKNSSKYEESASVLFEKLVDSGCNHAYFIVDKNYQYFDSIPKKYLPNIVFKNSFKHYLYFFKCKTFIGTEAMVHSIDLKLFNVLALRKVASRNLNYIFLQHGVMYMVSLDSESRHMFRRRNLKGKYRVVVSSRAEADHFVQLGRHRETDLYITGLPKFDRNVMSPDADKIVIMPTWRPWEINAARDDFLETSYFKMIMKIYNSVPEALKEKVIILPHPLIVNELKNLPKAITDTIVIDAKYDEILRQARILITDYSSIAYDAFYRGTRVIFYWEEKDFCMAQYGPSTKLMLNEDNVYGDYFYNTNGLMESIQENYDNPQKDEYVEKYSHIVEFKDGKNTDRLIQFLKDDELI